MAQLELSPSVQVRLAAPVSPHAQRPCQDLSDLELAQVLAARLAIAETNWHQAKGKRSLRAREQAAAAIVYLLRGNDAEARDRLQQAMGWLDGSLTAPPCPTHGTRSPKSSKKANETS